MKLLIIGNNYPTDFQKRAGIFSFDDYVYFKKIGIDVKLLILYRYTIERNHIYELNQQIKNNSIQIRKLKNIRKNDNNIDIIYYFSLIKPFVFWESGLLIKNSKFKYQKFDYVYVHQILHTGLNINWIRKQFPFSKIILKEHDNWNEFSELIKRISLKSINKFDILMVNSKLTKLSFEGIFNKYQSLVKNPPSIKVDYPRFHINLKNISKPTTNRTNILTVANLIKEKGFEESFTVLQILEEAKIDWIWKIIGKGEFYKRIYSLAIKYKFENKIFIIDEIIKPALYDYMIESSIYLQLSYRETFGITPIEAFSYHNKLLISDHITSINELIPDENKNILIIKNLTNIEEQRKDIIRFVTSNRNEEDFNIVLPSINEKINVFKPF